MQVLITSDDFGFIIEPYGIEEHVQTYWVSVIGTDRLWRAGWVPFDMPRVSRYVFDQLWSCGEIRQWNHRPVVG